MPVNGLKVCHSGMSIKRARQAGQVFDIVQSLYANGQYPARLYFPKVEQDRFPQQTGSVLSKSTRSIRVLKPLVVNEIPVSQRLEKNYHLLLLQSRKPDARSAIPAQRSIEIYSILHTRRVMMKHLVQAVKTPVVHIRCGQLDVAQGRHTKAALVGLLAGNAVAARIF